MIVHQCINCGQISSNRIAGDDKTQKILRLLEESKKRGNKMIDKLTSSGIKLLNQNDKQEISSALFGYDYSK